MAFPGQKMNRSLIGDLNEVLDELQGSIYFVKKLSATNARRPCSTSRRSGQLSMPRGFVTEHGNKFQRAVELRSDLSCNKPWPHLLSFCTSRIVPEVVFAGAPWGAFVTSHGLVQGDQLIFSLVDMSRFQVYVFNGLGDPKGAQTLHTPMKWPEEIKRPIRKHLAYCKSENKLSGTAMCTTNRAKIEDHEFPGCASNDTACQNSSFNNTPSQLPDFLSKECPCFPSFTRRLVAMNVYRLEIPKDLVAAHRSQLHATVQLQGIHEDSPAQNDVQCVCYVADGRDRMYLKGAGWDDFVSDNELRFGKELVFTLTADSCFTVREEISWNPRTGLNPGCVSVRKLAARSLSPAQDPSSSFTGQNPFDEQPVMFDD